MDFITSFLGHLFANIGSLGASASTLHSTITMGGTWTTSAGTNTIDGGENDLATTIGTGIVSLGTSVIDAADDAYNDLQHQAAAVQTSQAYIESLPERELDELIASLSTDEVLEVPTQEEVKTLAKRL